MLVAALQVGRGEVAEAFGGRAEEQGDRAGCPDDQGQGVVGEATLEEGPAVVLIEQGLRFLLRDGGDGELAGELTACGPVQEVADQVAALAGAGGDPVVDVLLGEVFECQFSLVDPGQ
ncbi:hypothetical protein ACFWBI_32625 [Streptomyces sp. NPDC059982]|uniref:hypothetical protein n=1 Tax=Streptomyces sp. NPDC059982 TaxID=3347024 RepID=UPI0036963625